MSNKREPTKKDIDRQLSSWSRRRVASWSLFVLAIAIAGQHLIAHGGFRPLPMGMGKQDIFFGYPMAALLGVLGAMTLDPKPRI